MPTSSASTTPGWLSNRCRIPEERGELDGGGVGGGGAGRAAAAQRGRGGGLPVWLLAVTQGRPGARRRAPRPQRMRRKDRTSRRLPPSRGRAGVSGVRDAGDVRDAIGRLRESWAWLGELVEPGTETSGGRVLTDVERERLAELA